MEQEENKHKKNSTGKIKDGRKTNTKSKIKMRHMMLMFQ